MAVARRVMSSSKPSRPRARPVVRKHVGKRNRSEADDEGEIEEQNQKRVNSRSMPVKTQKRKMVAAKTQKKTKGAAKSQRKTKVVSKPQKRKADKVVQRQVKKVRGAGPVKAQKKVTHASHPKVCVRLFLSSPWMGRIHYITVVACRKRERYLCLVMEIVASWDLVRM